MGLVPSSSGMGRPIAAWSLVPSHSRLGPSHPSPSPALQAPLGSSSHSAFWPMMPAHQARPVFGHFWRSATWPSHLASWPRLLIRLDVSSVTFGNRPPGLAIWPPGHACSSGFSSRASWHSTSTSPSLLPGLRQGIYQRLPRPSARDHSMKPPIPSSIPGEERWRVSV